MHLHQLTAITNNLQLLGQVLELVQSDLVLQERIDRPSPKQCADRDSNGGVGRRRRKDGSDKGARLAGNLLGRIHRLQHRTGV